MAKTMIQEKNATSQDAKKQRKKQARQEAKLMLKVEEAKKAMQKAEAKVAKAQTNLHGRNTELHKLEDQLSHLRSGQQEPAVAQAEPALQDVSSPQAEQDKQSNQNGSYSVTSVNDDPSVNSTNAVSEDAVEHATDTSAIPANQIDAQPPAEGRVDVSQGVDGGVMNGGGMNAAPTSASADSAADKGVPTTMQSNNNPQETPKQNMEQAEESLQTHSVVGSMPIESDNPQAWPPPEIREEVADATIEEAKNPQGDQARHGADTSNPSATQATSNESGQTEEDKTQVQQRYGYGDKG